MTDHVGFGERREDTPSFEDLKPAGIRNRSRETVLKVIAIVLEEEWE